MVLTGYRSEFKFHQTSFLSCINVDIIVFVFTHALSSPLLFFSFFVLFVYFDFFEIESHHGPGWLQTCFVTEAGFEHLLILLPFPPKSWVYRPGATMPPMLGPQTYFLSSVGQERKRHVST